MAEPEDKDKEITGGAAVEEAPERAASAIGAEFKAEVEPAETPVKMDAASIDDLFSSAGQVSDAQPAVPEDKENEAAKDEAAGEEAPETAASAIGVEFNADMGLGESPVETGSGSMEDPFPFAGQINETQPAESEDEKNETVKDDAAEVEAYVEESREKTDPGPGEIPIESGSSSTEELHPGGEEVEDGQTKTSPVRLVLLKVTGVLRAVKKTIAFVLNTCLSGIRSLSQKIPKIHAIKKILPDSIWDFIRARRKLVVVCSICLVGLVAVLFAVRLGQRYYSGNKDVINKSDILAEIQGKAVTMKPFLIAFDRTDSDVFLRMELNLVLHDNDERTRQEIKTKELILREAVYIFFTSKQLTSVKKGNKDKYFLEELCRTVNAYLKNGRVQRIVFSEYAFV
ncbi:MAG: flagellar basal body-associated FliL family protein [Pseudomonadota bacterium]